MLVPSKKAHHACGLAGMKPVNGIEVALWVANQRVRPFIPALCAGSFRKQSAAVISQPIKHQKPAQCGFRRFKPRQIVGERRLSRQRGGAAWDWATLSGIS
jgi:hypothetical protein